MFPQRSKRRLLTYLIKWEYHRFNRSVGVSMFPEDVLVILLPVPVYYICEEN